MARANETSAKTGHVPQAPLNDNARYVDLDLDPLTVLVDEEIKALRRWTGATKQEGTIKDLAASIEETGQVQRAVVWETPDGYSLIIGGRRREAVIQLREEGHEDIFFEVKVDKEVKSKEQAVKMAIDENRQREQFTEAEEATMVPYLRKLLKADGKKGTKVVADFMGVDPATVTQYERYLAAPIELQQSVESGRFTMTAALEALTTPVDQIAPVKEKAEEAAKKRAEEKTKKDQAKEDKKAEKEDRAPKPVAPAKPVVTTSDVRSAQRKVEGALSKPKAPRGTEWVEYFIERSGPAYPPIMSLYASTMADWGSAKANDEQAREAWEIMAQAMKSAGIADMEAPELKAKGPEKKAKAPKPAKVPKPKAPKAAKKKTSPPPAKKKAPVKAPAKKPAVKKAPTKTKAKSKSKK